MPLKIELKAGERLIIGNALITNDKDRTRFYIEGNVPILREKFVMTADEATSPCKRLYFIVQGMYLDKNKKELRKDYFKATKEIANAAPSLIPFLEAVNQSIMSGNYYNALKDAMVLINREKLLLSQQE